MHIKLFLCLDLCFTKPKDKLNIQQKELFTLFHVKTAKTDERNDKSEHD